MTDSIFTVENMDAREEQSHHGDEVMSSLSDKDGRDNAQKKNRLQDPRRAQHVTPASFAQGSHAPLHTCIITSLMTQLLHVVLLFTCPDGSCVVVIFGCKPRRHTLRIKHSLCHT